MILKVWGSALFIFLQIIFLWSFESCHSKDNFHSFHQTNKENKILMQPWSNMEFLTSLEKSSYIKKSFYATLFLWQCMQYFDCVMYTWVSVGVGCNPVSTYLQFPLKSVGILSKHVSDSTNPEMCCFCIQLLRQIVSMLSPPTPHTHKKSLGQSSSSSLYCCR